MLVIFDVDGTLIGGESFDWASFDAALESAAGFAPSQAFFDSLDEVTAHGIVHAALAGRSPEEREHAQHLVQEGYLERLKAAHRAQPGAFRPAPGAPGLLKRLRAMEGVGVAIATGDWQASIAFKIEASGLDIAGIPIATCSDCCSRVDIITLAAARAGCGLREAVYVGDGVWDLRACRKLGIPFIGTGSRPDRLRAAGAAHILPDLSFEPIWAMLRQLNFQESGAKPSAAQRWLTE